MYIYAIPVAVVRTLVCASTIRADDPGEEDAAREGQAAPAQQAQLVLRGARRADQDGRQDGDAAQAAHLRAHLHLPHPRGTS